ncbi:hypothetical protein MKW92_022977 [Papaver armeniacum]|nr:hypothetical protein MKW92_022977 [Papaver armeniacum]
MERTYNHGISLRNRNQCYQTYHFLFDPFEFHKRIDSIHFLCTHWILIRFRINLYWLNASIMLLLANTTLFGFGSSKHMANNLYSFNISWAMQFKKENSLLFRISYGFYNYRNSLRNRYGTQRGHFANNFSWIYCYDRIRLVYLDEMGGIAIPMPKIFTMFSSFSMASLALPGMSGFVAELVIFFGIITSPKYLLMPKILITFVMAIGMILTPIYSLSMSRQMFYGYKEFNAKNSYFFDSGPRELFVSICIFLPVIGIGIYPDFVLSLSVDKVEAILSNYFSR